MVVLVTCGIPTSGLENMFRDYGGFGDWWNTYFWFRDYVWRL